MFLSSLGGAQCSTEGDMPPQGVETQEYCQVSYEQDDLYHELPHLFLML